MTTSRLHPCWISTYAATFAGRTEAPAPFHWWTAVSMIAGALTRRVWIDEITFKYYPNFYIVFVAAPGMLTKSTAIGIGLNILRELDHVYMAPDNTNYPTFVRELALHATEMMETPAAEAEDTTWINQCAVTAGISELGTFLKIEDEDMLNGLTDFWDCRPVHTKETKFNGTDVVEHPYVNLIAGTTPDWVQKKLKGVAGWGLSSRIIFIHATTKAARVARPSQHWGVGEYEKLTQSLVGDLRHIATLAGPMIFSAESNDIAHSWYDALSDHIEAHNSADDPDPWVGYFLARKQAHVHKLAMILSCSRRDNLVIEADDMREAIAAVDAVELEIPKIFRLKTEATPLAKAETEVLDRLVLEIKTATGEQISQAVAVSKAARFVDSTTAGRMIENAVGRGTFKRVVSKGQAWLRLP